MNNRITICLALVTTLLAAPSSAIEFKKVEPAQPMQPIEKSGDAPVKKMQKTAPAPPVRTAQPTLVLTEPRYQQYTIGHHQVISWTAANLSGKVDILITRAGQSWVVARGVPVGQGSWPWRAGRHQAGYVKPGTGYQVVVSQAPLGQVSARSHMLKIFGDYELESLSYEPETRELTVEIFLGNNGAMLSPFVQRKEYAFLRYGCSNSSQATMWNQIWPYTPETLDRHPDRFVQTFVLPPAWKGACTVTVDPEDFVGEISESNNTKIINLPYAAPVK